MSSIPCMFAGAKAFALPLFVCGSLMLSHTTPIAAQPTAAQTLQPVVVTATRSETPVGRTLADVTVIDSQAIQDAGTSSLPELLRDAGGIEMSQNGGAGSVSGIFVRGTKTAQTLFLVDGMRIEYPLSGSGLPEFLPLSAIDRIEVVRGPASALYGSGAMGGVVQIFTRRAEVDGWRPFASAGVGSRGTRDLQAGFTSAAGATSMSLSASHQSTDGFEATFAGSPDYQRDHDRNRQNSLSASLTHRLAPQWDVGASLLFNDGLVEYDDAFSTPQTAVQDYRSSALSMYLRGRPTTGWLTELRLGHTALDFDFAAFTFSPRTDSRTIAWQNTLDAGDGKVLLGIESLDQRIDGEGLTRGGAFAYTRDERDTDSVFGGYERRFGDHTLRGTVRRDRITDVGSETTGALAWGWKFRPRWLLRASYGTAFRAPTFDDLYSPFLANPALRPEKSRGYELAAEYRNNGSTLSAIAFGSRIEDAIELDGSFTPQNLAKARVQGLTLEGRRALGAWVLRASATAQDTEGERVDTLTGVRTRDELIRRAPYYGSGSVERRDGAWRFGAQAIVQGRRFDTLGQRMGGYLFVDAWSAYGFARDWELFARLGNAFDREYETAAGFRTGPRTLFVGVRYAAR